MRASKPDTPRQENKTILLLRQRLAGCWLPTHLCVVPSQAREKPPKGFLGSAIYCSLQLREVNDQLKVTQLFRGRPKRRLQPSHLKTTSHSQDVERVVNGKHTLGTLSKGRRIWEVMLIVSAPAFPLRNPSRCRWHTPSSQLPGTEACPQGAQGIGGPCIQQAQLCMSVASESQGTLHPPSSCTYGDRNSEAEREGGCSRSHGLGLNKMLNPSPRKGLQGLRA